MTENKDRADANDHFTPPENVRFWRRQDNAPVGVERWVTPYLTAAARNKSMWPRLNPAAWAKDVLPNAKFSRFPKKVWSRRLGKWVEPGAGTHLKYNLKPSTLMRGGLGFVGSYALTDSALKGGRAYFNKGIDTRRRYMGDLERAGLDVIPLQRQDRADAARYSKMENYEKRNAAILKKMRDAALRKFDSLNKKNKPAERERFLEDFDSRMAPFKDRYELLLRKMREYAARKPDAADRPIEYFDNRIAAVENDYNRMRDAALRKFDSTDKPNKIEQRERLRKTLADWEAASADGLPLEWKRRQATNERELEDLYAQALGDQNAELLRRLEKANASFGRRLDNKGELAEMRGRARRLMQQAATEDHIRGEGRSASDPFRYLDIPGNMVEHGVGKLRADATTPAAMEAAAAALEGLGREHNDRLVFGTAAEVLRELAGVERKYKLSPLEVARLIPKMVYDHPKMKAAREHIGRPGSKYTVADYRKLHEIAVNFVVTQLYNQGYRGLVAE